MHDHWEASSRFVAGVALDPRVRCSFLQYLTLRIAIFPAFLLLRTTKSMHHVYSQAAQPVQKILESFRS